MNYNIFMKNSRSMKEIKNLERVTTSFGINFKDELVAFLKKILPFLRIKKYQALLVIDFIKTEHLGNRWKQVTKEKLERREKYYRDNRILHSREKDSRCIFGI